jgi:hypothetical protein
VRGVQGRVGAAWNAFSGAARNTRKIRSGPENPATDHGQLTTATHRVTLSVREAVPKSRTSVPDTFSGHLFFTGKRLRLKDTYNDCESNTPNSNELSPA